MWSTCFFASKTSAVPTIRAPPPDHRCAVSEHSPTAAFSASLYETIVVLFFGFFTGSHLLPEFLRSRRIEVFCRRVLLR
jgi:hypothetical protein